MFFLGYAAGQRQEGERLVVFLNSDGYLRAYKREPYFTEKQRAEHLMATGIVDDVIIFNREDAAFLIERHRPRVHCVYEAYAGGCPEIDMCNKVSTKIVIIPKVGDWSSSKLNGRTVYDLLEKQS
jgi:glycerol-3-phosphate cytidylyltransferase-like family protein